MKLGSKVLTSLQSKSIIHYSITIVLIGNLAPPVLKAVIAVFGAIPNASNIIVPALTFALQ
jgi:hypothetical protein